MTALYAAGRHTEALVVYSRWRHHLAEELGLEPSPRLRDSRCGSFATREEAQASSAVPLVGEGRPGSRPVGVHGPAEAGELVSGPGP